MFLSRSLSAVVLIFFSSIFVFSPALAAELDRCENYNSNNVLMPSGDLTKEDICNTPSVAYYNNLFYYDGPKAFCGDNKAVYCQQVELKRNSEKRPIQLLNMLDERSLPFEKNYWVKAFTYCGIDANQVREQYCEAYVKEGSGTDYKFEQYCKPEQKTALAERVCTGRQYTSQNQSGDQEFCGRHYKGKLDSRFKRDAAKQNVSRDTGKEAYYTKACKPDLLPQNVKKGSPKLTVSTPSSSSSSSGSNSSSSGSNAPASNDAPSAPAPSGVDDALNKAKKIKDLFNF